MSDVYRPGVPDHFTYAAANKDFPVEIIGNPFDAPKSRLEAVVTRAFQVRDAGTHTRFVARPASTRAAGYRIVMMMDPPQSLSAARLCQPPQPQPQPAGDGKLRYLMSFCGANDLLSYLYGAVPRPESPDDPAFARALRADIWELIPAHDPHEMFDHRDNVIVSP
jgi:hypothetical protein